jgi:hypothetical protein
MTTTTSSEQEIAVRVRLVNVSHNEAIGKAWWVLAPSGSTTPWDEAVFRSKVDQRLYLAGIGVDLGWNTSVALPNALYDLALIVHVVDASGIEKHADLRLEGPIRLHGPVVGPWPIRRQESPGPASVLSVSDPQPGSAGPDPFSRIVTIENRASRQVPFSAHVEAKTVLAGWEDRWWDSTPLYSSQPVEGAISAAQISKVQITASVPTPPLNSFPRVQFWISVIVDGKISDEVLIGRSSTFDPEPHLFLRPAAPKGPAAITGLGTPSRWTHSGTQFITPQVTNLTGNIQVIQVWCDLAAPDNWQPWKDTALRGDLIQITLGPWATQSLAMRVSRPPLGQWRLSIWMHYQVKPWTFEHSDVLFVSAPVAVN